MPLVSALEGSGIATAIRNTVYLFPLIESCHVIGVTLVLGTVLVIDLRLLGLASTGRRFTVIAADILKWTWIAFALTVATGVLMFITNASTYVANTLFWWKMALLVAAGLNMFVFEMTARRSVQAWDADTRAPRAGRSVAALSLVIWVAVIVLGRWVGFTAASTLTPAVEDLQGLEDLIPK